MSEIKKIIDERETRKNKQTNKLKQKRTVVRQKLEWKVRAKWFFCAFKLGFLQGICQASWIFKSNLELALWIILKQRELYQSKHVAVECRYLKIWDLLSFDMLLKNSFKMMISSTNIARTRDSTSKKCCYKKLCKKGRYF